MENPYEFLDPAFLEVMNEIGRYGHKKYGKDSFHYRAANGIEPRRPPLDRHTPEQIAEHADGHFDMYLRGELHDNFNTLEHQLGAVAFNAMMEFYFAGLGNAAAPK